MFKKTADCEMVDVLDDRKASSVFDEIMTSTEVAKASTLDEEDIRRQGYNKFRAIAEKKNNRLAVATRAISAHETWGPNKNGDSFERKQLEDYHKTFILKPHLWDHDLSIGSVRGILADSVWNKKGDYVETLIFIDKDQFPKYASNVEKGYVNSFSMGVEVKEAECSVCHNIATTPADLCVHAERYKGLYVQGQKCFEYNRNLEFIEQSAVASPADPNSHTLYILANAKTSQHKDVENLRRLAAVLDSYDEDDKFRYNDEFALLTSTVDKLANRIGHDLGIDFGDPRRGE